MGLSYAELELANYDDLAAARAGRLRSEEVRRMKAKFLADSGAVMLAINEDIANQLGLPKVEERMAEMADGSTINLNVVGPMEVRFGNRRTFVTAMVLPKDSEPLLGAIPMEDMDLVIEPKTQRIIINPAMPYISKKSMK
jgi:clan AA aspartic protease